jgi:hypothetical protein
VTRIPSHTIQDAPVASRPLLKSVVPFSPTGTHGTLDPMVRSALMLATAGVSHSAYAEAVTSFLAIRAGWSQSDVQLLRDGLAVGDDKIDSLADVVREAAARDGRVSDATWERAATCNYAQTPIDLPATPVASGQPE